MDVTRRDEGNVSVLDCPEGFDVDAGTSLRAAVDAATAQGRKLFVADLARTTFMGSAGMTAILTVASRLRTSGGYLVVANAAGVVEHAMKLVGVDRTVDMFDSLDVAVANLTAWAED